MTTNIVELPTTSAPSRRIAAEIRAEIARQGLSQTGLARTMHVGQAWLSRRIGVRADVDLTFEEAELMAEALGVSAERLVSWWLPRLDSNQQPSGYPSAQVIDLVEARIRRAA